MNPALVEQWKKSRPGSHAGRGFHYQDAVAAYLAVSAWDNRLLAGSIVPEGLEDISIQRPTDWLHIQAKSRRSIRGPFSLNDVLTFLETAWRKHAARTRTQQHGRLALVLETDVEGLEETGWDLTIAELPLIANIIRDAIDQRQFDGLDIEPLMRSTSIVVLADPRESALATLSARLGLPGQACAIHFDTLKSRLSMLGDENGVATVDRPATLTAADAQRIIDQTTTVIDLESLDEAIRHGICEVVDFQTPLLDSAFYLGIDVRPGHIVAGLTHDRPDELEQIIPTLDTAQPISISGPSGAGKSALAWMSAHSTRHLIRWYRLRHCMESDLPALFRLIHALRPSSLQPIGFVADNLGTSAFDGWDLLVEETMQIPGVRLIGVTRQENLFTIQSSRVCKIIVPHLRSALAERIWRELRDRNGTRWNGWKEPFEQSEGLLLEYGYLLTAGERLEKTVAAQVRQRHVEQRHCELIILRYVAAADVLGVTIDVSEIRALTGHLPDETLNEALQRLLNEHLVAEVSPSSYAGLHRLRPVYICDEVHRYGVPELWETLSALVLELRPEKLQPMAIQLLVEHPERKDLVVDLPVRRLATHPNPIALLSILQGLRVAGFLRLAHQWMEILIEEKVPPSKRLITAQIALTTSTIDLMEPSIVSAVARMTEEHEPDLRSLFLQRLPNTSVLQSTSTITEWELASQIFAASIGIEVDHNFTHALTSIDIDLNSLPARQVSQLIDMARRIDIALASALVEKSGGSQSVLNRLGAETPWLVNVDLETEADGTTVVKGEYRVVSDSQENIHDSVVQICKDLLGCAPNAEIVACRAIDASGETAAYKGVPVVVKRIPRRNLPTDADISWTRSRVRSIGTIVCSHTRTERLIREPQLLERLASALTHFANSWCRGQRISPVVAAELLAVKEETDDLPPPYATVNMNLSPLDMGELDVLDPVNTLIGNAIRAVNMLLSDEYVPLGVSSFISTQIAPWLSH